MEAILYLAHRIPYPPNKGDKIRSFHILRHLAARYRVFLACFVDDPADVAAIPELDRYCAGRCVLKRHGRLAHLHSLAGLARGEALSLARWRSGEMRSWVERTVAEQGITRAVVFSGAMAQYALGLPGLRLVTDFCDVDSAKFTQYAPDHAWPVSWVYRREGRRLLEWEARVARHSAASVFATRAEADLFERLAPGQAASLAVLENGVDTAYFRPAERPNPYAAGEIAIVFTGAMDYWPNVDAVSWFAREILPRLAERHGRVRFVVVGMNPAPAVLALAADPRVTVTGKVADVRPYVQHARVVVAPLRVARGIQNKVLEAMAMARPVVVSATCAAGLNGETGLEFATASSAAEFVERVSALIEPHAGEAMGLRARARILADRDWDRNLAQLDALLGAPVPAQEPIHAF